MSNIEFRGGLPDITSRPPEYVTKEQYEAMRNYVLTHGRNRQRNELLIHMLWYTAARVSDVLALRVSDIDTDKRTVRIVIKKSARVNKRTGVKSKPKVLELPLSADLVLDVMQYTSRRGVTDRIFDLTRQQAYNIVEQAGRGALGISVHPHMLRHGAAMQMMRSGRNTYEIQAWLAHSSPQVTFSTYARITTDMLRETARGAGLE